MEDQGERRVLRLRNEIARLQVDRYEMQNDTLALEVETSADERSEFLMLRQGGHGGAFPVSTIGSDFTPGSRRTERCCCVEDRARNRMIG
jgi:hypothetical protein